MNRKPDHRPATAMRGLLSRLRRDTSGNTMAIIAASIVPLLALVGGAIDMGRSYLAQTRLQAACDAGVLAARKKLGNTFVEDDEIPTAINDIGQRFFRMNFRDGAYGTENRDFSMALEDGNAISGAASVDVPTTIMTLFGYSEMPIAVNCEARLNFANTDIMFVLDTTASMLEKNDVDSDPRISILRDVVKDFHTQVEGSKGPGTTVRYGFVPYSTNVNVGHLLEDDWVVSQWTYQSREFDHTVTETNWTTVDWPNWDDNSDDGGSYSDTFTTYAATWHAPANEGGVGYWTCDGVEPDDIDWNPTWDEVDMEEITDPDTGEVIRRIYYYKDTYDGTHYYTNGQGSSTCELHTVVADNYEETYDKVMEPVESTYDVYNYAPIPRDVTNWRTETAGCMEERETRELNNGDFNQYLHNPHFELPLDLDINTVPTAGTPATQWRPMYPDIIWERNLDYNGNGSFHPSAMESRWGLFKPTARPNLVACPTAARKLAEMDADDVETYVDSLTPAGTTYHDIGMIWGGRLISQLGLFEDENADQGGRPTSRHLIFLTDGKTEAFDIAYGAYGVEPLDQRRWVSPAASHRSLDEVVEERFKIACSEVKKLNVTVWIIGFGVGLDPFMTECADHHYEANNATELAEAFSDIASQLGDLRITR